LAALLWILQTDIHNYFVGYHFSAAEYAIYAYGCFQIPLIAMLAESVNSVLIARLSELQVADDRAEIIRLMARAMQKLALAYFPLYVYLAIEGPTFVTTLFTRNYTASIPIFEINLLLLPLSVMITDAIFRAYEDLGKTLFVIRIFILLALVSALYFGIQYFDLRGMIAIVVAAFFVDKMCSTFIAWRKLGVKWADLHLLKPVGKTALASLAAGAVTFLFDRFFDEKIAAWSANLTHTLLPNAKENWLDFISGSLILGVSALVFAPVYFFLMNRFDLLEDGEKRFIKKIFRRSDNFS
jgi:O-antigen/teichoic acid export membrane protein